MTEPTSLELVRNFINSVPEHQLREVWCILTALRGPDSESDADKEFFTTPIRQRILTLHQATILSVSQWEIYQDKTPMNTPVPWAEHPIVDYLLHFIHHSIEAAHVINADLYLMK